MLEKGVCPHYEGMDRVCCKCVELICSRELSAFERFVNNQWDYLGSLSAEKAFTLYTENLEKKKSSKSYLFLTLSPDKKLRNLYPTEDNIKKLQKWALDWCEWGLKRYYHGYRFIVESGGQNNHLHLHLVLDMKSSARHAENIKKSWAKVFPSHQLLTTLNLGEKTTKRGEYCYLRFDDPAILEQKLDYLVNELKEEGHVNLVEVGVPTSGGSFKYK